MRSHFQKLEVIRSQREINDVQILPVELEHIWQLDIFTSSPAC